jgi:cytochrome b6-f complex iron-sulfur subunit
MSDPTPKPPDPPAAAKPDAGLPAGGRPAPPAPAKPGAQPTRRGFFGWLSWAAVGWITFVAAMFGLGGMTQRFMAPNVSSEPPSKFKAGFPDDFEEGKVTDRFKDQNSWVVKLRNDKGQTIIYALSTTCTHLGCTPNWLEREEKFKCPCHGSGFYITGVNFEGPAPRPLERWAVNLSEDGQVVVDKSKKFQQEMGQWDNPESFIVV